MLEPEVQGLRFGIQSNAVTIRIQMRFRVLKPEDSRREGGHRSQGQSSF
jgi:hypothetical protein